jgi:hypothetical protein
LVFNENDASFRQQWANKPMRALALVGSIILVGLLAACQTTDEGGAEVGATDASDDGAAAADAAGGGTGGLADDAVVRLQVEDYQQHLDEVILAYRFCVRASSLELDDGTSDPALVVERAQRRCEDEYRTVHRTAALLGDINRIDSLRAESQAAAMESLMASRAPS